MGLTLRLVLLAFIALVPAFAIQAYDEYTLRRDREAEVHRNALEQAKLAAVDLDRIFIGVQNLLVAVSKEPNVRAFNTDDCVAYLASLQPEVPYLVSISALDPDGRVWCRQEPPPPDLRFADRSYFQEAMSGKPFVVGEYTLGRVAEKPVLPLAIPMRDDGNQVIGVVAAALDLEWLGEQLRERGYPEGGSITVADRNGVIIAREPLPERFIGSRIPDPFLSLVTAPQAGTIEITSQDGTRRILGYVPVGEAPRNVYVSSGIPSRQAFAAVNAATRRGAILLGIGLLLALATALLAGRVFIKRPVDKLLAAAEAWRRGDLSVRTGLKASRGEIGRIGAEFDSVAEDVQNRSNALQQSEERLRLAVEATGIGIWDLDIPTQTRRWSPEFCFIAGLTGDSQPDGDLFRGLIHPDDRSATETLYRNILHPQDSTRYEAEFRIIRAADSAERWVLMTGRAILDSDGRALRSIGTIRDITERKQADAALRESEARLRSLADNLPNGMVYQVVADTLGSRRFLYISEGVERLIGVKSADVLRDPAILYEAILEEDLPRMAAAEANALATMELFSAELRMRSADGRVRWVQLASAPRSLPDGGHVWDGVALDITARKAAEQALQAVNETLELRVAERTDELAAANRELVAQIEERETVEATLRQMQRLEAVGQLTSGVAHDFNNLLTVILGNLEFLQRANPEPASARRIEMMRAAAERGAKLTDQLLAFSRRQRLEPRQIDLNETVSSMSDLLRSTMGGSVRLDVKLEPDLWPALVDPTQIELVILNLAINARDAMKVGGSLTVRTANIAVDQQPSRPEEPAPGEYVMISVADTGTGMPPEVLAKAFEPFFTTKEVGKGSGLGLAQVYGFAKQSGGGVRIRTALGEGTRVMVYLPRATSTEPALPARSTTEAPDRSGRANGTVLLVDDDAAVREVTSGLLQDLGYRVLEAGSGGAALQVLTDGAEIDLLLVDFAMPGMNGAEVAREARTRRPSLPILFVTGYADFAALTSIGEQQVIQKPYRGDDLARKILSVMNASATVGVVSPH
jgi:PAS domain S-box-containing protein